MRTISEPQTNLDQYLHTVRRIEEHREKGAVKDLQKLYKRLIVDLRQKMGNVYADYADAETGELTYAMLHRNAMDARLLEEVASQMNEVTQEERRLIRETVEQTYQNCYAGMVQAVDSAVGDDSLKAAFAGVDAAKTEALAAAVNNPVHGLRLSEQLEKNRADIIYGIKQAIGIGLSVGDRYDTMVRRIQKTLIGPDGAGGSYGKSVRIVRTEAHRCRELGNHDAARALEEKLKPAGFAMMKTWHTMKDERVRPSKARKTKKGWKYTQSGFYNHVKMEGVQVKMDEEFQLPSGARAKAPGQSGVAGEDINCRCFVSYTVVKVVDENGDLLYNGNEKISGAVYYLRDESLDAFRDKEDIRREKHAYLQYNAIRNRDTEKVVSSIYENISSLEKEELAAIVRGFKKEDVEIAFRHVFTDKHNLEKGVMLFDPDFYMAQSWTRLIQDPKNIEFKDLVLLRHERLEYDYMHTFGFDYRKAHDETNKQYNYQALL